MTTTEPSRRPLYASIEAYAAVISVVLHAAILYWALPALALFAPRPPLWTLAGFALAALALYAAGQQDAEGRAQQALLASTALLHAAVAFVYALALLALTWIAAQYALSLEHWLEEWQWASFETYSVFVLFVWMLELVAWLFLVLVVEFGQLIYLVIVAALVLGAFAACAFNVIAYRAFRMQLRAQL